MDTYLSISRFLKKTFRLFTVFGTFFLIPFSYDGDYLEGEEALIDEKGEEGEEGKDDDEDDDEDIEGEGEEEKKERKKNKSEKNERRRRRDKENGRFKPKEHSPMDVDSGE